MDLGAPDRELRLTLTALYAEAAAAQRAAAHAARLMGEPDLRAVWQRRAAWHGRERRRVRAVMLAAARLAGSGRAAKPAGDAARWQPRGN